MALYFERASPQRAIAESLYQAPLPKQYKIRRKKSESVSSGLEMRTSDSRRNM